MSHSAACLARHCMSHTLFPRHCMSHILPHVSHAVACLTLCCMSHTLFPRHCMSHSTGLMHLSASVAPSQAVASHPQLCLVAAGFRLWGAFAFSTTILCSLVLQRYEFTCFRTREYDVSLNSAPNAFQPWLRFRAMCFRFLFLTLIFCVFAELFQMVFLLRDGCCGSAMVGR